MFEDILDINIRKGSLHRSFINKVLGSGDGGGNKFGVRLKDGSEVVSLSGAACVGYFIRPDGITLVINGSVENNTASVTLPSAAYAKEGQFALAIKVTGSNFVETTRIVDGTIIGTTTGDISDPSDELPSLEELLAVIAQAEDAADTIYGLQVSAVQISGTRYKMSVIKE